jgi:alcohol dehydrogenase class IV
LDGNISERPANDSKLTDSVVVKTILESLERERFSYSLFNRVRIEPSDDSMKEAIGFPA